MKKYILFLLVFVSLGAMAIYRKGGFGKQREPRRPYKTQKIDEARILIRDLLESGEIDVNIRLKKYGPPRGFLSIVPGYEPDFTLLDLCQKYSDFGDLNTIKYLVEKGATIDPEIVKKYVDECFWVSTVKEETERLYDRSQVKNPGCQIQSTFKDLFQKLQYLVLNGPNLREDILLIFDEPISGRQKLKIFLQNILKFQNNSDKISLFFIALSFKDIDIAKTYLALMLSDAIKKINESKKIDFDQMSLYKLYNFVQDEEKEVRVFIGNLFELIGLDVSQLDFANFSFGEFLRYILWQIKDKKIEDRQFALVDKAYDKLAKYLDIQERGQMARKFLLKEKEEIEDDESIGKIRFKDGKEIKYPKVLL